LPASHSPHQPRRVVRGLWMVLLFLAARESDVFAGLMARRLEAGTSPLWVALQLVLIVTQIPLGQCSYWPVPFRWGDEGR
jgi:hypothetical protein